jgi:hypothetical protein
MQLNLFQVFIMAGALLGIGLAIHLFWGRKNTAARLLGLFTLMISIASVEPLINGKKFELMFLMQSAVAIASFLLGPFLFLYCKYRLNNARWKRKDLWHFFLPCVILLLLIVGDNATNTPAPAQNEKDEVILYLLFVVQLFTYTFLALSMVLKNKISFKEKLHDKLRHAFLRPLVVSSLIMFLYSVINTFFPLHSKNVFVILIQAMLGFLIVLIALLNAETLEKHRDSINGGHHLNH